MTLALVEIVWHFGYISGEYQLGLNATQAAIDRMF
jgi:hypothetical protein